MLYICFNVRALIYRLIRRRARTRKRESVPDVLAAGGQSNLHRPLVAQRVPAHLRAIGSSSQS
eukprot:3196225-Pyramimonas_sp.AAC.1